MHAIVGFYAMISPQNNFNFILHAKDFSFGLLSIFRKNALSNIIRFQCKIKQKTKKITLILKCQFQRIFENSFEFITKDRTRKTLIFLDV